MRQKGKLTVVFVIGLLLISILVVGTTSLEASDHPWPYVGQNTRGTRRSPYDTSHVDGTLKWMYNHTIPFSMLSPVVDSNGNVYISSSILFAFNSEGERLWNFTGDLSVSSSPGLGPDGTVYVGGSDGVLYALNPNDGTEEWRFDAGSKIRSSPIVGRRNTIYFGTDGGDFFALDGLTRTMKWNNSLPPSDPEDPTRRDIVTSPVIEDDGTVYFGSFDNHLYAVNEGELIWRYNLGQQVWSSPSLADDGTIYVGGIDGLYAINPDGSKQWIYQVEDREGNLYGVMSSPAIGEDGTIYFGAQDNSTYALYSDGSFKWNLMTDSYIHLSSPAIGADGTIYIGSFDTVFYAIDEDKMEVKWYYNTTTGIDSSPAIGPDGTVYVGNNHGNLYAFTGSEDETDINWYIIGGVVGIVAAVAAVFIFKKQQKT